MARRGVRRIARHAAEGSGSWRALIAASPFMQLAAYDGNQSARPRLADDAVWDGQSLVWHELGN